VLTSQVKETNSTVDIGYHYVANSPGTANPQDYDGDGIADYLEDRNGNGTYESGLGETDWTTGSSGITGSVGLQVFTPLR
jgi:hypothetical protein